AVPKAYVVVSEKFAADAETARSILAYCRENLAPYKRIRRLEFAELPKTISGKIRRVELRAREDQLHPFSGEPVVEGNEYADTDCDLTGGGSRARGRFVGARGAESARSTLRPVFDSRNYRKPSAALNEGLEGTPRGRL